MNGKRPRTLVQGISTVTMYPTWPRARSERGGLFRCETPLDETGSAAENNNQFPAVMGPCGSEIRDLRSVI